MIKVALVRGAFLNNYEGQNYQLDKKNFRLVAISSLFPLENNFPFSVIKLLSLADIQKVRFLNLPLKFVSNRVLGDAQILLGIEKYAKKFDIFHSADPHYYYTYQLAKLKKAQKIKKLIITSWETIPFNNEKTLAKRKIKYFSLAWADLFLCYTERAKRVLIQEGVNESKIKVIKLGVNVNRFKPPLKKQNQSSTILFVGRLVDEKGILDLLEAFINLKKHGFKDIKLEIVGRGVLEKEIKRKIKLFGLSDKVRMTNKSYKDMPLVYQNADIFVLPSKKTKTWEEQYGMVLIEAMASGLPIIASKSGAIPEILRNCGLYFNEGVVDQLTKQLINLITNKNLRKKLGKMGRDRAKKMFDCRKTARKIEEIYRELINY